MAQPLPIPVFPRPTVGTQLSNRSRGAPSHIARQRGAKRGTTKNKGEGDGGGRLSQTGWFALSCWKPSPDPRRIHYKFLFFLRSRRTLPDNSGSPRDTPLPLRSSSPQRFLLPPLARPLPSLPQSLSLPYRSLGSAIISNRKTACENQNGGLGMKLKKQKKRGRNSIKERIRGRHAPLASFLCEIGAASPELRKPITQSFFPTTRNAGKG